MESRVALIGVACAIALIPNSSTGADFTGVTIEHVVMPGCARTFRYYANFTGGQDQRLAINGNSNQRLSFQSNVPLYNDGGLISGLIQEDKAQAPISGPQDSWVTIEADGLFGNDTSFSPGFAGGDGIHAVVVGTEFEDDSGGWFDSDPSTPVIGRKILIAQFSMEVEGSDLYFTLEGNVAWKQPGDPYPIESSFHVGQEFWDVCACDLALSERFNWVDVDDLLILLANWGPCPDDCCLAGFNADGEIGFEDLVTLLAHWGYC